MISRLITKGRSTLTARFVAYGVPVPPGTGTHRLLARGARAARHPV